MPNVEKSHTYQVASSRKRGRIPFERQTEPLNLRQTVVTRDAKVLSLKMKIQAAYKNKHEVDVHVVGAHLNSQALERQVRALTIGRLP